MTDTCKSDHTNITASLGFVGGGESSFGAGRGAPGHPPAPDKDSHHRRKSMSTMLVGSSKASGFDSEAGSARYRPPSVVQQPSARSFRTSKVATFPVSEAHPCMPCAPAPMFDFLSTIAKRTNLVYKYFTLYILTHGVTPWYTLY